MNNWIFGRGWLALGVGVVSLVGLGWLSLQGATIMTFALYAGWDGGIDYLAGRSTETGKEIWRPLSIEGVLDWIFVVLAFLLLLFPFVSAPRLLAAWFVLNGGLTMVSAQRDRNYVRRTGYYAVSGFLSLLVGAFLFVRPIADPYLHWIFCAYLIIFGALMLMTTSRLGRRSENEPAYQ